MRFVALLARVAQPGQPEHGALQHRPAEVLGEPAAALARHRGRPHRLPGAPEGGGGQDARGEHVEEAAAGHPHRRGGDAGLRRASTHYAGQAVDRLSYGRS